MVLLLLKMRGILLRLNRQPDGRTVKALSHNEEVRYGLGNVGKHMIDKQLTIKNAKSWNEQALSHAEIQIRPEAVYGKIVLENLAAAILHAC